MKMHVELRWSIGEQERRKHDKYGHLRYLKPLSKFNRDPSNRFI